MCSNLRAVKWKNYLCVWISWIIISNCWNSWCFDSQDKDNKRKRISKTPKSEFHFVFQSMVFRKLTHVTSLELKLCFKRWFNIYPDRWNHHCSLSIERNARFSEMKPRLQVISKTTPWPWLGGLGSWKLRSTSSTIIHIGHDTQADRT